LVTPAGHESTVEEIDEQLSREAAAAPRDAEDEYEPANESSEDLPPFPLIPVDQLPPFPKLVLVLGLVSNSLRDTEIVTEKALREQLLTRILRAWARFVAMLGLSDGLEVNAEDVARAVAAELNVRDERVERFVGEVIEILPLALAFGGISGTLTSSKLVATVSRRLDDDDWFCDPVLAIFGIYFLYDVGLPGWSTKLNDLLERHGSIAGVRSLVPQLMFIAYIRQDLDPADEQRMLEFLAEQTLEHGNVRTSERGDRRGRAIASLQTFALAGARRAKGGPRLAPGARAGMTSHVRATQLTRVSDALESWPVSQGVGSEALRASVPGKPGLGPDRLTNINR
jgi:hypothetical protein